MRRSGPGACAVFAALTLATSVGATSLTWSGRWSGHPGPPTGIPVCPGDSSPAGCIPRSTLAATTVQFTFRASGIDYYGVGLTAASHDSPTAKGWCRIRFVFDHVSAGWSYYRRSGSSKFAGEGGPGVACETLGEARVHFATRVRQAGAKLKVQFGDLKSPPSFTSDWPTTYLTRSR